MSEIKQNTSLQQAEAQIEAHSSFFKKELGLVDLILAHLLFMIAPQWFATAAKLGNAHIVFWLLTIPLFFLPLVSVVIYLNRLMPLEGGLYQWAKLGFNEFVGFLLAWNLWFCIVMSVSQVGFYASSFTAYALGARGAWINESKLFLVVSSSLIITVLVIIAIFGFAVGKWLHNLSGVINLLIFTVLIALPLFSLYSGKISEYHPFTIQLPSLSLLNLNIFGKMAFGAFCGFEYMAIFAGECRNPARNMGLSALVAAPIIIVVYILGTSAMLQYVKPEEVDLLASFPQVFNIGFSSFWFAKYLLPTLTFSLLFGAIAVGNLSFNGNTRLPMVAGWDQLLPGWFTSLSPRYQTPIYSIIFVGAVTLVMALASSIGVGQQEAYQLLQNAAGICYALAYLVMFAIPLIGLRGEARPPLWLRIASLSGFLMTLLYLLLSVFPIIEVESWLMFGLKIITTVVAANILGVVCYLLGSRRKRLRV